MNSGMIKVLSCIVCTFLINNVEGMRGKKQMRSNLPILRSQQMQRINVGLYEKNLDQQIDWLGIEVQKLEKMKDHNRINETQSIRLNLLNEKLKTLECIRMNRQLIELELKEKTLSQRIEWLENEKKGLRSIRGKEKTKIRIKVVEDILKGAYWQRRCGRV